MLQLIVGVLVIALGLLLLLESWRRRDRRGLLALMLFAALFICAGQAVVIGALL